MIEVIMQKIRIRLDTQKDILEFVEIANTINQSVYLVDDKEHKVNAKSILGCLYSTEFDKIYVMSENRHTATKFQKFMI